MPSAIVSATAAVGQRVLRIDLDRPLELLSPITRAQLMRCGYARLKNHADEQVNREGNPRKVAQRRVSMQYLVQLELSGSARPITPADGIAFIEQFILPTLEMCNKLQEEKKIVAGGPVSGAVALILIVNAESAKELDDLITSLPVWPRMETEVTPLTSFHARMKSLVPRLEALKTQARETSTADAGQ